MISNQQAGFPKIIRLRISSINPRTGANIVEVEAQAAKITAISIRDITEMEKTENEFATARDQLPLGASRLTYPENPAVFLP